jgi:hypothetical protein
MNYQDIENIADKHVRNLTATHEEATEIVSFDTVVFHKYDFLLELKTKMKEAMMEIVGEDEKPRAMYWKEELEEKYDLLKRNKFRAQQRQRVNEFFEEEEIAQ